MQKKVYVKISAYILALFVAFSASLVQLQVKAEDALDYDTAADCEKIAETNNLSLYANLQTGDFILKNIKTGKLWYSSQPELDSDPYSKKNTKEELASLIVIKYVHNAEQNSNPKEYVKYSIECVNNDSLSVEQIDNGIKVCYDFSDIGISVPVLYFLSDGCFNATVDLSEVKENGEGILTQINLLPGFGAERFSSQGYIFVPDGSGAVIDFNNGVSDIYEQRIYGEELNSEKELYNKNYEPIRLPVFGIACDKNALFAVITEGEGSASITAASSSNTRGYNTVSSIINTRVISSKVMFAKNWFNKQTVYRLSPAKLSSAVYSVRYYALENENANYVGMAKQYRTYLTEEKNFKKRVSEPALNIDFLGAIETELDFLGITFSKKTSLTTFKQAKEILEDLSSEAVDKVSVRYIGWSNSGISNRKIPKKAKPLSILGGKSGLKILKEYLEEKGNILCLETDLITFRKGNKSNAVQTAFNETAMQKEFLRSVYAERLDVPQWKLVKPKKIGGIFKEYVSSYKKLDLNNVCFSSLSNTVYSDLNTKNTFYRSEFPALAENVLSSAKGLELSGEAANAYALPYLSKIYYSPVYSSNYNCFSEDVPFYQIVLHGYLNLTVPAQIQSQDADINFLKAVESGSELLYVGIKESSAILTDTAYDNYYSANYSLWKQDAIEKYKQYMPLLNKIYQQEIISHKTIAKNVRETVFENGVKVIVNYNDIAVTVNEKELPPTSFLTEE